MQFLLSTSEETIAAPQTLAAVLPGGQGQPHASIMGVTYKVNNQSELTAALEIHDLITQKLFSASLIADVLPRLWEIDPSEGRVRLIELRELTMTLMAEMQCFMEGLRCEELQCLDVSELNLAEEREGKHAKGRSGSK